MVIKSRKRGDSKVTKEPVFLSLDRQGHVVHQVMKVNTKEELIAVIKNERYRKRRQNLRF